MFIPKSWNLWARFSNDEACLLSAPACCRKSWSSWANGPEGYDYHERYEEQLWWASRAKGFSSILVPSPKKEGEGWGGLHDAFTFISNILFSFGRKIELSSFFADSLESTSGSHDDEERWWKSSSTHDLCAHEGTLFQARSVYLFLRCNKESEKRKKGRASQLSEARGFIGWWRWRAGVFPDLTLCKINVHSMIMTIISCIIILRVIQKMPWFQPPASSRQPPYYRRWLARDLKTTTNMSFILTNACLCGNFFLDLPSPSLYSTVWWRQSSCAFRNQNKSEQEIIISFIQLLFLADGIILIQISLPLLVFFMIVMSLEWVNSSRLSM